MEKLAEALGSRQVSKFDDLRDEAEKELGKVFSSPQWGITSEVAEFTDANYSNLWRNELDVTVRRHLEEHGVTEPQFADWLGEVHFVHFAAYRSNLFADGYKRNEGWRVSILGFPTIGIAAVGVASHYQNAQDHGRLAEASRLMFQHAQSELERNGLSLPGREIGNDDWSGVGLIPTTSSVMCGVELPDGRPIKLKYVRTTTVKKILASYVSIASVPLEEIGSGGADPVFADLQRAGEVLA